MTDTPKTHGAWPEDIGVYNHNDPIKLTITLERKTHALLCAYVGSEKWNTSFTGSIEQTIETLIRGLVSDGIDLDFIKDNLAPEKGEIVVK